MALFSLALRWVWVLGLALFFPVTMPVGGGERKQPIIQVRRHSLDPLLMSSSCKLRSRPLPAAPPISNLQVGTPVNVLRCWIGDDGKQWLYVQIVSLGAICSPETVRRGWLNV